MAPNPTADRPAIARDDRAKRAGGCNVRIWHNCGAQDCIRRNTDTRTFVDNYRTPHSEKLHVVERYHLIEGGKTLQADITIEDPATFIQPLQVIHRWRRAQGAMIESSCPEGNFNYFNQDVEPLPTAERPDF
jgi:hypothetical protein